MPRTPAAFDAFFLNICVYVNAQCTGTPPRWTQVPLAARTALNDQYAAWHTAYVVTLSPYTSQQRAEMRRLLEVSTSVLRNFVNTYLRYHPDVTADDKLNMGLRVPSGSRPPVKAPDTAPGGEIIQKGPGMLGVIYRHMGGKKGSKPDGVTGARVHYGVFDTPPTDQDQLPGSVWASRAPTIITFREGDRGKRAYIALRWEIEKGGEKNEGPWSEILSEIIP
jgi:hypothetical protein